MKTKKNIFIILVGVFSSCGSPKSDENIKMPHIYESKHLSIKDVRIKDVIEQYASITGHEGIKCIIVDGSKDEARIILASTYDLNDLKNRSSQETLFIQNDTFLVYSTIDRVFLFENETRNSILESFKSKLANVNIKKKMKYNYHGTWAINYAPDTFYIDKLFPSPFGIQCINCVDQYRFPIK